jgi:UDP-2,3-diacylglucosamine pyrophosphatase LpxH
MWSAKDLIVVSDWHLAPERGMGMFRADAELAQFLAWILVAVPNSTIVLAGDILDFLIVEHGERAEKALHPAGAPLRAASIVEHHPEVFDALSRVSRSSIHHIVWISGNHDPELVFPSVEQVIEARLGLSTTAPPIRWLVHGEAAMIRIGEMTSVIEHGDMFDDWSRIDHDALRRSLSLASRGLLNHHRYIPPPGSQLVVEYLIGLREEFPWLYLLKPEREALIPILYAFLSRKEKYKLLPALRHWLSSFGRSAISEIQIRMNPARIVRSADATPVRRRKLHSWLEVMESQSKRRFLQKDRLERIIPMLREVAAADNFFDITVPDDVSGAVTFVLQQGIDLAIQGHTHSARANTLAQGLYINSGTWAHLLRLPPSQAPDKEWREFLQSISRGGDHGFLRPTFVHVTCSGANGRTSAALMQWHNSGPSTLAKWCFVPSTRVWKQEG